ncbi:MAG: response regulator, partial [Methanosarcinaceae archaeon]|nr:response regulator [Methanosarcinaceae archaeon]
MKEKARILIVDDNLSTCRSLSLIFQKKGYEVKTVTTGKEALEVMKKNPFNIVLLDLKLPDTNGIELISPIKEMLPECTVIMITGYASLETSIQAMNVGADFYLTKPLNIDEVLFRLKVVEEKQDFLKEKKKSEEELQQSLDKLRKAFDGIIQAMVLMLEVRDPYTAGHQRRVTLLACAIAREMGESMDQLEGLRMAGMIHDIGKVYVPSEILSKPGQLTEMEFQIIKTHPQ